MTWLSVFLALFAVLVIACDQSVFFGNQKVDSAVGTANDAFNFLSTSFTNLDNDGEILDRVGMYLYTNATTAASTGCPEAGTAVDEIQQFQQDMDQFLSYVDPVPGYVSQAKHGLNEYGVKKKNAVVWVLYVVTLLVAVGFCVGLYCRGKLCLQYDICLAVAYLCVLIILCAVGMILMMGLADFCESPIPFALQVMGPDSSNYEMASYYATCNGTSPLQPYLDSATEAATYFNDNIGTLETLCPTNVFVQNMAAELPLLNMVLSEVINTTACPPYQAQIEDVLQEGICNTGFTGFAIIWISQYVTAFLLFALTVLASVTYQFFGQYWAINMEQQRDEVALESPVYNYNYTYYDGNGVPHNSANKV